MTEHYDVVIIGSGAGRRDARAPAGPVGKEDPHPRARRLAPARARELGRDGGVRQEPLRLQGHLVRPRGQVVPAAGALQRGRRDEVLRSRALPAAGAGLRRAAAPRRHLARVAGRVRRVRAVLHAGRGALPGARRARRGPHRTAVERSVPVPAGLARAAHPAALRRHDGDRPAPVPLPLGHHARTRRTRRTARASGPRRATGSRACCTPSPTRRSSRCGPPWSTRTSRWSATPRCAGSRPTTPGAR